MMADEQSLGCGYNDLLLALTVLNRGAQSETVAVACLRRVLSRAVTVCRVVEQAISKSGLVKRMNDYGGGGYHRRVMQMQSSHWNQATANKVTAGDG